MSLFITLEAFFGLIYLVTVGYTAISDFGRVNSFPIRFWVWNTIEIPLILCVTMFVGFPDYVWYFRKGYSQSTVSNDGGETDTSSANKSEHNVENIKTSARFEGTLKDVTVDMKSVDNVIVT